MSLLAPAQVFGGCCLNVYSLESFLGQNTGFNAGPVISLAQLLSVCATAMYPMVDFGEPRRLFLKKTKIPMPLLLGGAVLFFIMSVLGNSIYSHGVSVPVQITFRSSSVVFSMLVNYLFGHKRYSRAQIASAGLMTVGSFLIISQHSDFGWRLGSVNSSGKTSPTRSTTSGKSSAFGLALLTLSSVLGAFLGLYTENVFAAHGRHWNEVLFYNHFLSVSFLLLTKGAELRAGIAHIWASSPKISVSLLGHSVSASKSALLLVLNSVTQVFCARGVNHLSSVASSLTVTVVLLVRKFVSLVISAVVFQNPFNMQGLVGSALLIVGTLLYAQCCQPKKKKND